MHFASQLEGFGSKGLEMSVRLTTQEEGGVELLPLSKSCVPKSP